LNDPSFDEELTATDGDAIEEPAADYGNTAGGSEGQPGQQGSGEHAWGEQTEGASDYVKYHVAGVTVKKVAERVQYYDTDGKLITESFKDYTRNTIKKQFATMDEFIKKWQSSDRKQAVIDELANEGVIWEALEQDVSRDLDPFDLICHVAFDQPPLTRKERADNVKKRNYFGKYSEAAQTVLNALLDKYADSGVVEIESKNVLKVTPFDRMGRPLEIVKNAFGSKQEYEQAISDLEQVLYDDQHSA
jgi:type I restriction enzyme R subunit